MNDIAGAVFNIVVDVLKKYIDHRFTLMVNNNYYVIHDLSTHMKIATFTICGDFDIVMKFWSTIDALDEHKYPVLTMDVNNINSMNEFISEIDVFFQGVFNKEKHV